MWQEAIGHVVGCWTNDEYEFAGQYWQMPRRRVQPKPWQKPHPPLWGATTSDEGHAQVGDLGLGLCSFAVGLPPSEVKRKIDIYRAAVEGCTAPIGAFVNDAGGHLHHGHLRAGPRRRRSPRPASPSSGTRRPGARQIATLTDWMAERQRGSRHLCLRRGYEEDGRLGHARPAQPGVLIDSNACVLGTPEECVESLPPVRGGGRRPAALPRQPVQGLPRVRDADDRADGDQGHPALRRLSRGRGQAAIGQA